MTELVSNQTYLFIIMGAFLVTYLPRMLPLVMLSKINLPKPLLEFLNYIPVCILAAILLPELILHENSLHISIHNVYLIAGILTIIVSLFSRKLIVIAASGIVFTMLLRLFL